MKKKVMCMLLTGMMAASMIAGCGNSGNASANAGADTNTDASTDASGAADNSTDQSADVTPDTTAASAAAESGDFDNSEYINVVSREDGSGTRGAFIELFGVEEKNDAGEKVDNTTVDAQITNNTSVMMSTVAGNHTSTILAI